MKRERATIGLSLAVLALLFAVPAAAIGFRSSGPTAEIEQLAPSWVEADDDGFRFADEAFCDDASELLKSAVFEAIKLDDANPGSASLLGFGYSDGTLDFEGRLVSTSTTQMSSSETVDGEPSSTSTSTGSTSRDNALPAASLVVRRSDSSRSGEPENRAEATPESTPESTWCAYDLRVYAKSDS